MTIHPNTTGPQARPELPRVRRTIVVVDVVESVRLMQQHEDDVIDRWRRFVNEVRTRVLPARGGQLVKSLGDGMLLAFDAEPTAVAVALELQQINAAANQGRPSAQAMLLRVGAHSCSVVQDDLDVYGPGVNLAARLAANAGAGEIHATADVLDGIAVGLDADVEDLGELYFKHIDGPTRAFRIGPVGPRSVPSAGPQAGWAELLPVVAVIPMSARSGVDHRDVLGEVLADELISGLSRASDLRVISRLSTTGLRGRTIGLAAMAEPLQARFLVNGAYLALQADLVRVNLQLTDARSQQVVWSRDYTASPSAILAGTDGCVADAVAGIGAAISRQALELAATAPLPSLDSCSLLLGAIALMHRATRREFDRARAMLEVLAERHRRQPQAHAWLAKWHVLRAVQGWTDDKLRETREALACVQRALDADPGCALALAIEGLVQAYLRKDVAAAEHLYQLALQHNPSESLAWLFTSTLHSYRGEGEQASRAAERALGLSPLDPMKYFFDSLAATAVLSSGHYARAVELAQRSLRLNRSHTSTYRTLAIAQMLGGAPDDARDTVQALRRLEPELSVSAFVDRYPGTLPAQVDLYAQALRAAGLPD